MGVRAAREDPLLPDQHLGRWTGHNLGIPMDRMLVWDPDLEFGGLTPEQIRNATILLWKGHCSVHQMFQLSHIQRWREANPAASSSPPLSATSTSVSNSDHVGSTEHIVKTNQGSAGQHALAGRYRAESCQSAGGRSEAGRQDVQFMAPTVCMCSTMQRIDPQHLAWTLENLADGKIVNPIRVPEHEAVLAKLALERMLAVS